MTGPASLDRGPLLPIALLAVTLLTSCLSVLPQTDSPPLSLYAIVPEPTLEPMMPLPQPMRVKVALLEVDTMVQRTEILVRSATTPSDVRYLPHHRWAEFPAVLVTESLREHWQNSGGVGTVLSHNSRADHDAVLRGRMLRFEGLQDDEDRLQGHLVLDLWVQENTGRISPFERIEVTLPCPSNDPAELARCLSLAVRDAAQQALPGLRMALHGGAARLDLPFNQ